MAYDDRNGPCSTSISSGNSSYLLITSSLGCASLLVIVLVMTSNPVVAKFIFFKCYTDYGPSDVTIGYDYYVFSIINYASA
jgi:hypothetical protein